MKKTATIFLLLFGFFAPLFSQTDAVPPTIVCKQTMLEVNIMPTGMIWLWAEDYLYETLYDNVSTNLEMGLRKTCMGVGFPEESSNIVFYYPDFYDLEVWARDEAGNTASYTTKIRVTDYDLCFTSTIFSYPKNRDW